MLSNFLKSVFSFIRSLKVKTFYTQQRPDFNDQSYGIKKSFRITDRAGKKFLILDIIDKYFLTIATDN